jgi:hypothetical protein
MSFLFMEAAEIGFFASYSLWDRLAATEVWFSLHALFIVIELFF